MSTTGFLQSSGGKRIFWRSWPAESPRGAVLVIHGFAEHSGRYENVAEALNQADYTVHGVDLRGHGSSEGVRGFIERFEDYLDDVETALTHLSEAHPDTRLYLLGHSMGGLIALGYAARHPEGLAGLLLSAPFFGISMPVPGWKKAAAGVLSRLMPKMTLPSGLEPKHLSHDPAVVAAYEKDPLVFTDANARWFTELSTAQEQAPRIARNMRLPLLVQSGGDDRLVDLKATRAVFSAYGGEDKALQVYEGFFHEVYNEVERVRPLNDLVEWLKVH